MIVTKDHEGNELAQGSGFFISPQLVVTNLHVLKRAVHVEAKSLSDGAVYGTDVVFALGLHSDLCILQVNARGTPLPVSPAQAEVGQDILVAGNPEGLEATFSKGIISATRPEAGLLQIDASISPGSSGGPVINQKGEVVGVAVSTMMGGQNLNFAVPIQPGGVVVSTQRTEIKMPFVEAPIGPCSRVELFGPIPVEDAGRIAITDREAAGFQGPVKTSDESKAQFDYQASTGSYVLGPKVRNGDAVKFNPDGRLKDIATFDTILGTGKCLKATTYGYGRGGLGTYESREENCEDKGRKTYVYSEPGEALYFMASRIHIAGTETSGDPGDPDTITKYDNRGLVTEFWPFKGSRNTFDYDDKGRETERRTYLNGKLYFVTRSTYEVNSQGDWVRRHQTLWDAQRPALGYTPSAEQFREITYYGNDIR
jgi:hypothetical protein